MAQTSSSTNGKNACDEIGPFLPVLNSPAFKHDEIHHDCLPALRSD
jgi:hypothetical protein